MHVRDGCTRNGSHGKDLGCADNESVEARRFMSVSSCQEYIGVMLMMMRSKRGRD